MRPAITRSEHSGNRCRNATPSTWHGLRISGVARPRSERPWLTSRRHQPRRASVPSLSADGKGHHATSLTARGNRNTATALAQRRRAREGAAPDLGETFPAPLPLRAWPGRQAGVNPTRRRSTRRHSRTTAAALAHAPAVCSSHHTLFVVTGCAMTCRFRSSPPGGAPRVMVLRRVTKAMDAELELISATILRPRSARRRIPSPACR